MASLNANIVFGKEMTCLHVRDHLIKKYKNRQIEAGNMYEFLNGLVKDINLPYVKIQATYRP